jgi:ubiquinone/menaquinone biosynthesis C-methylase UbiE
MARADFARIATVYDAGRSLPDEAMETWRAAIARYVRSQTTERVLDLGCGTGRFGSAIARWFSTEVVGIEPSLEMLRASISWDDEGVAYVQGQAEALPLAAQSCDWAWLSTVIHHFDDLQTVARELRRVLRPGGAVLVRNWFPGGGDVVHFRYFPGARRIAETFPTISAVADSFAIAGFSIEAVENVTQSSAAGLKEVYERACLRADTTLQGLSDEEFDDGLRRLKADADAEAEPQEVVSHLGLLVLR